MPDRAIEAEDPGLERPVCRLCDESFEMLVDVLTHVDEDHVDDGGWRTQAVVGHSLVGEGTHHVE